MKPEEVNAMTDVEKRIKAAELDGWTQCASRGGDGVLGVPPKEWLDRHCDEFAAYGILYHLPDYLNETATAWELVESAKKSYESSHGSVLEKFTEHILSEVSGMNMNTFVGPSVISVLSTIFYGLSPRRITEAFILAMTAEGA